MNTKTNITYDRHHRQYLLLGEIGEELSTFPAGEEDKRAAAIAQLEIEAPAALELALLLAARYTALESRALKAAQIIMAGGVRADLRISSRWLVDSQSGKPEPYTVTANGYHTWHCSCVDWKRGYDGETPGAPTIHTRNGRVVAACKHILAVVLTRRLADAWPPACPDCQGAMNIRRQRNNGSGLPFWSCTGFPHRCQGRREFTTHPDDAAQASSEIEAGYLSMERAKAAGLVTISANGQRLQRERELEQARWEHERAQALPMEPATRGRHKLFKT